MWTPGVTQLYQFEFLFIFHVTVLARLFHMGMKTDVTFQTSKILEVYLHC